MTKGKKILAHAVLILASFLSVFPLYYMLCGATNTSIETGGIVFSSSTVPS